MPQRAKTAEEIRESLLDAGRTLSTALRSAHRRLVEQGHDGRAARSLELADEVATLVGAIETGGLQPDVSTARLGMIRARAQEGGVLSRVPVRSTIPVGPRTGL
jgi:hypothetical protein